MIISMVVLGMVSCKKKSVDPSANQVGPAPVVTPPPSGVVAGNPTDNYYFVQVRSLITHEFMFGTADACTHRRPTGKNIRQFINNGKWNLLNEPGPVQTGDEFGELIFGNVFYLMSTPTFGSFSKEPGITSYSSTNQIIYDTNVTVEIINDTIYINL